MTRKSTTERKREREREREIGRREYQERRPHVAFYLTAVLPPSLGQLPSLLGLDSGISLFVSVPRRWIALLRRLPLAFETARPRVALLSVQRSVLVSFRYLGLKLDEEGFSPGCFGVAFSSGLFR